MQPLFAQNLLLLSVLGVSYLIWAVMEVSVEIRQRKRFRAGAQRQDKGSHMVIGAMIRIGNAACWLLAFTVPATAITSASVFLFWLGIALVYAGLAFRLYAIKVLGRYFTTSVAVVADRAYGRRRTIQAHSSPILYRLAHHVPRIWAQLYELVESAV